MRPGYRCGGTACPPAFFIEMMMRSCVFIDGENLRYSLVNLFSDDFDKADYLPKNARWNAFFDFLVQECHEGSYRLRTYWYVVERIDFRPWKIPLDNIQTLLKVLNKASECKNAISQAPNQEEKAQSIGKQLIKDRQKMENRFSGWQRVHNAIAVEHDAVEFRRAGTIQYNLFNETFGQEKAVDVKLAVDLLEFVDIYDTAIIVSGDGDYVPAVQAVKNRGKQVVNVSFETRSRKLLPGGARSLNQITDKSLIVQYDRMREFMVNP